MSFDKPTVADFEHRFKQFANKDEYLISFLLDEAANVVDTSWLEKDYVPAILYLTAHLLVTETSRGTVDRAGAIVSESFGPISTSYAVGSVKGDQLLMGTEFGRRYAELRKRNFPGPKVVG